VETLVQEKYAAKYEKTANESNVAPMDDLSKNDNGFTSIGNLSVTNHRCASEIQGYLSLPVKNVIDPLKWWMDNKYVYPNLHHMALDYLSIPGKSDCSILHKEVSDILFGHFYCCQTCVLARSSPSPIHVQLPLTILNLGLSLLWLMGMVWPCGV
jgi:hypothetical protein